MLTTTYFGPKAKGGSGDALGARGQLAVAHGRWNIQRLQRGAANDAGLPQTEPRLIGFDRRGQRRVPLLVGILARRQIPLDDKALAQNSDCTTAGARRDRRHSRPAPAFGDYPVALGCFRRGVESFRLKRRTRIARQRRFARRRGFRLRLGCNRRWCGADGCGPWIDEPRRQRRIGGKPRRLTGGRGRRRGGGRGDRSRR